MLNCVTPSPGEVIKVGERIIPYTKKELLGINELMPMKFVNSTKIIINRPDIIRGTQSWRGLGGQASTISRRRNRYGDYCTFEPGYWGDSDSLGEAEIGMVAEPAEGGAYSGEVLSVKNEIARMQRDMTIRMLMRMEKNVWDTLVTGRYIAKDNEGNVIFEDAFNTQHVRVSVPWNNITDSAPLAVLRSLPEEFRNSSANFTGKKVRYYMNRTTANRLLENRNPNDIGKGNLSSCCTTVSLDWINAQLDSQNLGQIVIYDNRWVDENDLVHLFIPDGVVVVKGTRPDSNSVGNYMMTKVLNGGTELAGESKGVWYIVNDNIGREDARKIKVSAGHNGGPIISYPETIIALQVW